MPRLARGAGLAAALVGAGCALTATGAVVVALGLCCVVLLAAVGHRPLVVGLVAATFVTRLRFDVAGASFRLEHLALVVCVIALLLHGRAAALGAAGRDRTVVLVAAFIGWSAVVSLTQAVDPAESMLIVGWLALDWVMVTVLVASTDEPGTLVRPALVWCGIAAATAIVLRAAADLLGTGIGVSTETLTGTPAAHGFSHEPNILAATLALWGFVALTTGGLRSSRAAKAVVALSVLGIVVTLTRAAVVGLAGGLLVWALLRGRSARRVALRLATAFALTMAALWLVAPGLARPVFVKGGQLVNFGSETGQVRVEQWRQAVDDLDGVAWLIGLGSNSFGQRHLEPTLPETPTPAYLGNLPLQVLYDSGLVGVVLLGAAVLSAVTGRRLRDGRAAGLLTVYVLCAVATSPFWFGTTWVFLAIAIVDRRRATAEPRPAPVPTAPPRSVVSPCA